MDADFFFLFPFQKKKKVQGRYATLSSEEMLDLMQRASHISHSVDIKVEKKITIVSWEAVCSLFINLLKSKITIMNRETTAVLL